MNYIISLVNAINKANIIYWSLIKYKQIIYHILVASPYKMGHKIIIKTIINTTLKMILGSVFWLILYSDSKFLYNDRVILLSI